MEQIKEQLATAATAVAVVPGKFTSDNLLIATDSLSERELLELFSSTQSFQPA